MADTAERYRVANAVLKTFSEGTEIAQRDDGRVEISWPAYGAPQRRVRKVWMLMRGSDTYPVWHRDWARGGTATLALSHLVRWVQGKSVVPIRSWVYWGQEGVRLIPAEYSEQVVNMLRDAGWPRTVPCVLCGIDLASGFDWWHLEKVVGPCCGMSSGCRQIVARR